MCRAAVYVLHPSGSIADEGPVSIEAALECLRALEVVLEAVVQFVKNQCSEKLNFGQIVHAKYKVSALTTYNY